MPANLHTHWRDQQAWKDLGFRFNTYSNEAVKLWDAAVTQYVGWYDDDSMGGLEKTVESMMKADPQFAMGKVLSIGLDLMGTARNVRTDPSFQKEIDDLCALSKSCNSWERKHILAIKEWSKGQCKYAASVWEDLLTDNPLDILALKFAHDHYVCFGRPAELRDSSARVFPHWKESTPLYCYLFGMHSFGLVETNFYDEAERVAKKGLELNAQEPSSAHSLIHVYEMQGRAKEGIEFMNKTVNDWSKCNMLACHNYWHWALYHIEKNEHQAAVDIFDNELSKRCQSGAMLDIADTCSLLYRLELEGIKVGTERWEQVYEVCRPHQDEHVTIYNDLHLLMSYLGAKKPEMRKELLKSLENYIETYCDDEEPAKIGKEVGYKLSSAMTAYDEGNYDGAVEDLLGIRYKIVDIGGSNAERDVFNLLLINSALQSDSYQNLCRNLIYERQILRKNSTLTDRLMAKWVAKQQLIV